MSQVMKSVAETPWWNVETTVKIEGWDYELVGQVYPALCDDGLMYGVGDFELRGLDAEDRPFERVLTHEEVDLCETELVKEFQRGPKGGAL